jgi:UDP-N-acetylglucosamine pyrophosphorylase
MKHTIEWHEECHANALQCLIAKKTQLDRLRMEILRNEKELEFREHCYEYIKQLNKYGVYKPTLIDLEA